MSTTVYTAHIYVAAEDKEAYFELPFDNEMEPELVVEDSIIHDFAKPAARKKIVSDAFDSNRLWEDDPPHTLMDEISDQEWADKSVSKRFNSFCATVKKMSNIKYVLFAVDSDQENWRDKRTFWYDAKAVDFEKNRIITVEWRGTKTATSESFPDPFHEETAKGIVEMLENGGVDQIDVGDYKHYGKSIGKVKEQNLGKKQTSEFQQENVQNSSEADLQEERVRGLIQQVDGIDFEGKNFVLAADYMINGNPDNIYDGDIPLSPKGFISERGGLVKKSVSGKTDYLVIDPDDSYSMRGAKARDALAQIEKGKPISIISLLNLKENLQI